MRFLVNEKAYETPVASGLLRYERDEAKVGINETWRLTRTTHGEQILRVDYDSRVLDGRSFLFHLVMSADDEPQRLVYRYLGDDGGMVSGNVLFSAETILNSRKIGNRNGGHHFEEELPAVPLLFPTVIGAGFAARALRGQRGKSAEAALLDMHGAGDELLKLQTVGVTVRPQRTRDFKIVRVGGMTQRATTLALEWNNQSHKLWLELQQKWPLKMVRENGLTAQEAHFIWYG